MKCPDCGSEMELVDAICRLCNMARLDFKAWYCEDCDRLLRIDEEDKDEMSEM